MVRYLKISIYMLGIDISDRSIKLVEVADKENGPVLRTVCWLPMSQNLMRRGVVQDVTAVTQSLKDAMVKCSPLPVLSSDVVASIPEVQSFCTGVGVASHEGA